MAQHSRRIPAHVQDAIRRNDRAALSEMGARGGIKAGKVRRKKAVNAAATNPYYRDVSPEQVRHNTARMTGERSDE
jgi:hypothetical protein